jgi:hypothetical protein
MNPKRETEVEVIYDTRTTLLVLQMRKQNRLTSYSAVLTTRT